jgi:hypothetical protein
MNNKAEQYRIELLARVLLATAGLLGAFILLELAAFFVAAADADNVVAAAKGSALSKPAAAPSAETKAVVDGLKKNNLFAPPAQKQYPVNEVIGILGDQALINGQWYKVGDSVADARILAIEPTKVKVVWNGQEKEFTPMSSTGQGGPEGPGPGRRGGPPVPGGPPMVVTGGRPGPMGGQGQGIQSPEEMEKMREQWRNMSPEERQKYREEMRARFGRRSQ